MNEIIELIEVAADFIIVAGSAWIAFLFWRTYKRTDAKRSLVLCGLFAFLVVYFTIAIFVIDIFPNPDYAWMEGHEALEFMLMAMIVSLASVLTVPGSWKGSKLKPQDESDREKAA